MGSTTAEEKSEIAFFDLETTVPTRSGQGHAILEFGAILVCPRRLMELRSYSTLVRPANPSLITSFSERCNGITREDVSSAPTFSEIADDVYDILHGRIWAGHNIQRFDCPRIREAFENIGRPAPEPKGIIDSLILLTQKFGRRAGDMKMATLATYFEIGKQEHRSLADVRMNLEVLKYCATVLFLEWSLPDLFTGTSSVLPKYNTRSSSNFKLSPEQLKLKMNSPSSSPTDQETSGHHPISSLLAFSTEGVSDLIVGRASSDPFDLSPLNNEIKTEAIPSDVNMEEKPEQNSPETSTTTSSIGASCSGYEGFLEPDEVSVTSIRASFVPFYRGTQRIKIFHNDIELQLFSSRLMVRFAMSKKYVDHAGRPRLSFAVDVPPSLLRVLEACDNIAQELFEDSRCSSEWRHVVTKKPPFSPITRLHIPIVANGVDAQYGTEIHQRDSSGTTQKLVFGKIDAAELEDLFCPRTFVDAFLSVYTYDYLQRAGIRLVAKKLVIHSDQWKGRGILSNSNDLDTQL